MGVKSAKGKARCGDYYGVSATGGYRFMPFDKNPDDHTRIFGTRRQKLLLKLRAFRESLMKRFLDWRRALGKCGFPGGKRLRK